MSEANEKRSGSSEASACSADEWHQCRFGDLQDGERFLVKERPTQMLTKNGGGLVTNEQIETCGIFRDEVQVLVHNKLSER